MFWEKQNDVAIVATKHWKKEFIYRPDNITVDVLCLFMTVRT